MPQYKLEIFSRDLDFIFFSPIIECKIKIDYQQSEKSKFKLINKLPDNVLPGFIVCITPFYGKSDIYMGVLESIETEEGFGYVYCKDFYELLYFDLFYERNNFKTASLEENLELILEEYYGTDPYLRLRHKFIKEQYTNTEVFNLKDNIFNLFEDVVYKALYMYDLYLDIYFDKKDTNIVFRLKKVSTDTLTIELSSPDVIHYEYNRSNSASSINTLHLVEKTSPNESNQPKFYLLKNGEISGNMQSPDRILPIKKEVSYFEFNPQEDYYEDVLEQAIAIAKDKLKVDKYDHQIVVELKSTGRLIYRNDLILGKAVKVIISTGEHIDSIITGIELKEDYSIVITLGNLRINLTDKLKKGN